MGLFNRKPRSLSPAEEAARRRHAHIPEGVARPGAAAEAHRPRPDVAGALYEFKTLRFSQIGFASVRTDVDAKLAPYLADGWEVVTDDRKRYGVGGRHSITIRRARR